MKAQAEGIVPHQPDKDIVAVKTVKGTNGVKLAWIAREYSQR